MEIDQWGKATFAILITALIISCGSGGRHRGKGGPDSSIAVRSKDSLKRATDSLMALGDRPDSEQDSPSQAEERKRLEATYNNIHVSDTTFDNGKERLSLRLKYYCLKDSEIVVPKKYDLAKQPTDFVTHPFICDVILINGTDTVLNKRFTARDFYPYFKDPFVGALKKYGTLSEPTISNCSTKDNFVIHYSLSIPVTDLGIPVELKISEDGSYKIKAGY